MKRQPQTDKRDHPDRNGPQPLPRGKNVIRNGKQQHLQHNHRTATPAFTPKHVHARKRDNAKNDKKENGGPVSQQRATPLLAEHRAHIVGEKRVIHHQKHGISNACEAFTDTKHPSPTDRFWRDSAGVATGLIMWSVVHKNTVYPMGLAALLYHFCNAFRHAKYHWFD